MANQLIRPSNLPDRANPVSNEVVQSDNGSTVAKVTWADGVAAGRPLANQSEAEAGANATKAMTPLTTKQAIDAQVPGKISAALASYTPTSGLGTAAFEDVAAFATAAQGSTADTAVQPGDFGANVGAFLATPTSANLASAVTDETGSGALVFGTSPTLTSPAITTPTGIVKGDVGLGNVDNTSDATKWAATATLTNKTFDTAGTGNSLAINGTAVSDVTGTGKVVLDASPALTGTPTAPTAAPSDNSTKIATTAYVEAAVSGGVAGVASLNGQTGALALNVSPQGRVTLTSATPVMASSVAGATTVYYTPSVGNMVPIYDGTNMVPTVFTELSQATTDATKSPAAVAATSIYDLFVGDDSGTIRCTRGPAWTDATTRGYTLTAVNGIYLNTSTITNGPAASRGTWVGTIRSNASSTIDFKLGDVGSGGVAAELMVWNVYNRVEVGALVTVNNSITSSSNTIQAFGAASYVDFVIGAAIDAVSWSFAAESALAAVSGAFTCTGVGYDTTSAFSYPRCRRSNPSAATLAIGVGQSGVYRPSLGRHYVYLLHQSDSANSNEFNNTLSATLAATIWM